MNFIPKHVKKIYLIAICGTGMGSLAGLLKSHGYEVAGSDNNIYPPMSLELAKQGIPVFAPFADQNVKNFNPDLIIVGNAVSRTNPESEYMMKTEIPYVSMPQALNHFFLADKDVIVMSGTHGKTTSTTIMAYLLNSLGLDPSYLIGGVSKNFASSFHIGSGKYFVIEGDEYDTAFFDKGPKFLHYNPKHVVMTSLEFDHADIYQNLDHLTESFAKLAKLIPEDGSLHYCDSYPRLQEVAGLCLAPKRCYGMVSTEWEIDNYKATSKGTSFDISENGQILVHLDSPMPGKHNALNVAACFSVLKTLNLDLKLAANALSGFSGVKRRQEVLFEDENLIVIDDFAHHPTAVFETIQAIKTRYPERKITTIFEPRSNSSMRDIFQKEFTNSFLPADEIILAPVFNPQKISDGKILNVPQMVAELRAQKKEAYHYQSTDEILKHLLTHTRAPSVALIMSNGSFDNIHNKLIQAWKAL